MRIELEAAKLLKDRIHLNLSIGPAVVLTQEKDVNPECEC